MSVSRAHWPYKAGPGVEEVPGSWAMRGDRKVSTLFKVSSAPLLCGRSREVLWVLTTCPMQVT